MECNIYVGFLFLMGLPPSFAAMATSTFFFELAENWNNTCGFQSCDILSVSAICVRSPGRVGAKVKYAVQRKMGLRSEDLAQRAKVEPLLMPLARVLYGVVQIEAVYVRIDSDYRLQK
jgi:hypothetical protein